MLIRMILTAVSLSAAIAIAAPKAEVLSREAIGHKVTEAVKSADPAKKAEIFKAMGLGEGKVAEDKFRMMDEATRGEAFTRGLDEAMKDKAKSAERLEKAARILNVESKSLETFMGSSSKRSVELSNKSNLSRTDVIAERVKATHPELAHLITAGVSEHLARGLADGCKVGKNGEPAEFTKAQVEEAILVAEACTKAGPASCRGAAVKQLAKDRGISEKQADEDLTQLERSKKDGGCEVLQGI